MPILPDKLKEAVKKNNLVIFVGAGTSVNLKNQRGQNFGNWTNLVREIICHINGSTDKYNYLLGVLEHHEPIAVLQLIESSKEFSTLKKDIYSFVKDYFELHPDNNHDLHQKITKLCPIIITTNYDTAFENCTTQLRNRVAYKGKNYELTTYKDDKPLLFKLHGCLSDVGSMVLFPSNYDSLYAKEGRDAQHTLAVLKNLVYTKNILFIGAGMGDFQINHIFQEIKKMQDGYSQPHFIISKQHLDSSLNFLEHISIAEHQEIDSILDALLEIKMEAEQEKDKELKEKQQQIAALEAALEEKENIHRVLIEELFQEALDFEDEPEKACKKYKQISLLGEFAVIYYNWGNVLGNMADTKDGAEKEALSSQAVEKYAEAVKLEPDYHEAFYNWGTDLGNLAATKEGAEKEALYVQAFEKFAEAVRIKPEKYEVYNNWGVYLSRLAATKEGAEKETLYTQAFEKFAEAVRIKLDYHEAFYNWGTYLSRLAATKEGAEKETLYTQTFEKFAKAVRIKPDYYEAFYNWGNGLGRLAAAKHGVEKGALYAQAVEKFAEAVRIKPDEHEAYYNWGTGLGSLAATKDGAEKEALYAQAVEKFIEAVRIKPEYHEAYNNWGNYLGSLADIKDGAEKEVLYAQAIEKFAEAVRIKLDYHEAFYNWGNGLGSLAATKKGTEKEALLLQALEKFQKSYDLGGACYNLACLYALKKEKQEALFYLKESLEKKEITTAFVLADTDWSAFLEDADFKQLIERFRGQE